MVEKGLPGRALQDRRGGVGGISGGDMHVHDTDFTSADRGDRLTDRSYQLLWLLDRTDADATLTARHRREIDFGAGDRLPDPPVLDRPATLACDPLLVQLVVKEREVVGDDDQQRDVVADRSPEGGNTHQEIAVSEHRDRQTAAARVAQSQRGADCHTGPRTNPAAAIGTEIVERMAELPQPVGPGERQPQHRYRSIAERGFER